MGKATVIPVAKTHVWLKTKSIQQLLRPCSAVKYAPEIDAIEAWSPVQRSSEAEFRDMTGIRGILINGFQPSG